MNVTKQPIIVYGLYKKVTSLMHLYIAQCNDTVPLES